MELHARSRPRRETGITSGPEGLTRDRDPEFVLASSPPGATFTCTLNGAPIAPCTTPLALPASPTARYTLAVAATDDVGQRRSDAGRAHVHGRHDRAGDLPGRAPARDRSTPARCRSPSAPTSRPRSRAPSTTASTARARRSSGPRRSRLGEHVFRARAEDAAGNIDATPVEYRFTVVNAAPSATLALDPATGPAPLTDPAPDRRRRPRRRPADLHARLRRRPGGPRRAARSPSSTTATRPPASTRSASRSATAARPRRPSRTSSSRRRRATSRRLALTLSLSAPAVDLGTFIPGVARDYTATLTATTTGGGTLTVADRGANPGHLVGPAGALAQPLTVRGTSGAFAALTGAVAVPGAVEFRQPIGAERGPAARRLHEGADVHARGHEPVSARRTYGPSVAE